MKWFLFLFAVLVSCKQEKRSVVESIEYDSSVMPKKTDTTIALKTTEEKKEISLLDNFFIKNIDQSSLKFYKVDPQFSGDIYAEEYISRAATDGKKISRDSIRVGKLLIVQISNPEDATLTSFKINGKTFSKTALEEPLLFNDQAFRHFSFKGKEYYYMQANILYFFGGSIGNVYYHIIYDVRNKEISTFTSCRFDKTICFGDANGDDRLDFLHFMNDDFCTLVPSSADFEVNLYSCNSKGKFEMQKDKKGKPYYIYGNSGESYTQDSFNTYEHYWPLKIK